MGSAERVVRRIGCALLLLAALALYLFVNHPATLCLLVLAALPPFCALLYALLPKPRLSALAHMPAALPRGQQIELALTLRSDARLPRLVRCTLRLGNTLTGERQTLIASAVLRGRREHVLRFTAKPMHCGLLTFSPEQIVLPDPFGLFEKRLSPNSSCSATVLPTLRPLELALADAADLYEAGAPQTAQLPGYDPAETVQVRDYVPGDPIRQIHWKLSEKADRLLVREFGRPQAAQVLLLFETAALPGGALTPERTDALLDGLCAVSHALLAAELPHTLGWYDGSSGRFRTQPITVRQELDAALRQLLSTPIRPGDVSVIGRCLSAEDRCDYAHIAVFSACAAPELSSLCHGNRVTLLLPPDAAAPLSEEAVCVQRVGPQLTRLEL